MSARGRDASLLAVLLAWGCASETTLTRVDVGGARLVPQFANAPLGSTVPVLLHVAQSDGTPVANVTVQLQADTCTIQQPTAPTDPSGETSGAVSCGALGQNAVGGIVLDDQAQASLGATTQIFVYPAAADGSNAVVASTALNALAVAYDALGHLDETYRGTVHFTSTDPAATLPADVALGAADCGVRLLPGALVLRTAADTTVTASDQVSGQVLSEQRFTVLPAGGSAVALTFAQASVQAGVPTAMTLTARDSDGNVDSRFVGTVTLVSTDGQATLPASVTLTAADGGRKTLAPTLVFRTAGTQSVSVLGQGSGTQASIEVVGGPAVQLQLQLPESVVAGASTPVTVQALDVYGNVSPDYTGTVTVSSSDAAATVPPPMTCAAGVGSGTVVLRTAGLTALDASDAATPSVVGDAGFLTVDAAAPARLQVTCTASLTAGQTTDLVVLAVDAFDNPSSGYSGLVQVTSSDPAGVVPGAYRFHSADLGTHAFPSGLQFVTAGPQSVQVVDSADAALTGTQTGIAVSPAALSQLSLKGLPSQVTAGNTLNVVVAGTDAYENTIPSYQGTIHFSSSDPQAVLPADQTLGSGDAGQRALTQALSLRTASAQSVLLGDSSSPPLQGTASSNVQAAALSALQIAGLGGSAIVSQRLTPQVSGADVYGNTVTSYRGSLQLSSSDPQAVFPPTVTITAADNGTVTLSNSCAFSTPGQQTLAAQDAQTGVTGSASVNVQHGCAPMDSSFEITGYNDWSENGAAVAFGPNNQATIAFYGRRQATINNIFTRTWTGTAWIEVDNPPPPAPSELTQNTTIPYENFDDPVVAIDSQGGITVGYVDANSIVQIARRVGNAWQFLPLPTANPSYWLMLAYDASNVLWASWQQNSGDQGVHLQRYFGGSWASPTGGSDLVPGTASGATTYGFALDPQGRPQVAYSTPAGGNFEVYVTALLAGAWQGIGGSTGSGGISQNSGRSDNPHLAVDGEGRTVVGWSDDTSGSTEIYLLRFEAGTWQPLANSASGGGVTNRQTYSLMLRLRTDPANDPVVLYDGGGLGVGMLRYNGTAWVEQGGSNSYAGINPPGNIPNYGDMALDANGNVYMITTTAGRQVGMCSWR